MKYTFVGDVHGKFNRFNKILGSNDFVVQVGDLGIGFNNHNILEANFNFIHGNHDNPDLCEELPQFLGRFGMYDNQTMFLSGGFSIDKAYRTPGVDWWHNEQLSTSEFMEAFDLYVSKKPKIMVTHDCPLTLYAELVSHHIEPNNTATNLDVFFNAHQPKFWIFGHHHKTKKIEMDGTIFICLAELETVTLEV